MTEKDNNENDALEARKKEEKPWKKEEKDGGPKSPPPLFSFNHGKFRFSIWFFIAAVVGIMLFNALFVRVQQPTEQLIEYSEFKNKIISGEIKRVHMAEDAYLGSPYISEQDEPEPGSRIIYKTVPVDDSSFVPLLDEKGVTYYAVQQRSNSLLALIMNWVFPLVIMIVIWRVLFRRIGNMGSGVMQFGRNRAQVVAEGDTGVTFSNVAGADEAKEELVEVVDFLKKPDKYLEIGGKIPKGVLLVGAPGTGKTLLARAVAGEGHVPFFRMSGADFVEMFVGVGAARVRDLFKQAREKAPCIIFIDELDAIGKSRLAGAAGGNDEREQTLNQLLVEMDGFDSTTGVILLAATNRPEVLDAALLRPGRFDRQVVVDKPDLKGREEILAIHSQGVKLSSTVDLHGVAKATPGFVGADLANVVNEAALLAVREGRKIVEQHDFMEAIEKAIAGLKKKNRLINDKERKIVAYHETGHALAAAFTEGSDPVQKITIVPRGIGALGYTLQTPTEDRFLLSEHELLGKIDVLLGGRAAERIIFDEVSTGAANDLVRATDIARKMITEYGMSEKFKNVVLTQRGTPFLGDTAAPPQLNREYSESTQQYIDEEVARIIDDRFSRVLKLLESKRDLIEKISIELLEKETIEEADFRKMVSSTE